LRSSYGGYFAAVALRARLSRLLAEDRWNAGMAIQEFSLMALIERWMVGMK
jgi:hypothetical protein